MCSTSLMVPVLLLAGMASALRMLGGKAAREPAARLAPVMLRRNVRREVIVLNLLINQGAHLSCGAGSGVGLPGSVGPSGEPVSSEPLPPPLPQAASSPQNISKTDARLRRSKVSEVFLGVMKSPCVAIRVGGWTKVGEIHRCWSARPCSGHDPRWPARQSPC